MSKTISAGHAKESFTTIPVQLRTLEPRPHLRAQKLAAYIERLGEGGDRFRWVGFTMLAQSVIITPLVSVAILATANWMPLWFAATVSMYASFIPSLAGLHVKWIRAVFLVNCFVSLLIVLTAVLHLLIT